jgi:hypothetical protein
MQIGRVLVAALTLLSVTSAAPAGVGVSVGIGFGPRYYRPYPGRYYYRPYPLFVAPPPVVLVHPAPVVAVPAYTEAAYPAPAAPAAPQTAPQMLPAPTPSPSGNSADLESLNDPSPQARADAIIRLGRNKDHRAVQPIIRALREDTHPQVREAAARALGLIGAPAALGALQNAAGADKDRDVRRTASFAAEVIRASMRR